jgi:hypothetical protein
MSLVQMTNVWCVNCEMWLNGPTQMKEHSIGKKHKESVRRGYPKVEAVSSKIDVPVGVIVILRQQALSNDCALSRIVMRSLYTRISARL